MKKPLFFYTIADEKNLKLAKGLENSFKKFHKDIPFHIVTGDELTGYVENDPQFFYRATPILSEKYLEEYELVVKLDADQIVLGDLSYIWETKDYDVGTVLNFNKVDPLTYGYVELNKAGITPVDYFNCGLVAIRNKEFAHIWKVDCFSPQFERLQYREQDILNILCYYANFNVRCFDHQDPKGGIIGWWGLIGKSKWKDAVLVEDKIMVMKHEDNFPGRDTELKVVHMAGGGNKSSWGLYFSQDVMKRINYLIGETK